jgi:hypothetical protein
MKKPSILLLLPFLLPFNLSSLVILNPAAPMKNPFNKQLPSSHSRGGSISPRTILNNVFDKIATIKTLHYQLTYKERVFETGKYRIDSSSIKYQKLPRRIYIKMSNGAELLWGPDVNEGDALIHPNSFPYFNLSLNPDGYWMRKNQHHSIDQIGFDYFESLVKASITRAANNFDTHFFYTGDLTFKGFQCMEIQVLDPDFKFVPYTVKAGETILTIARSLNLNEYLILKHNPKVSSYTDVKPGQIIMIPSNYGMQVKMYIDKNTMLPVMMRIDDEKGLFEEYDYKRLDLNPDIKQEEFSKSYKDYHF